MGIKVPSFNNIRTPVLFFFGLIVAGWELVIRHGQDEAVLVFLTMCLGFQPAKSLDVLLKKSGGIFAQPPISDPETVRQTVPKSDPEPVREEDVSL